MTPRTLVLSLVYAASLAACSGGTAEPGLDGGEGGGTGGSGGSGGGTAGGAGGGTMACTCTLPNATAACGDAGCALVKCNDGFRDLDRDSANGCESTCQPLMVTASGSLDFDAKVLSVSGLVTQNGGVLAQPRGLLRFELAGSKPLDVTLPGAGAATYAVKLFAGHTRVSYVVDGKAHPLKNGPLLASGALDFDVPAGSTTTGTPIVVNGALTVNGAAMASRPAGARAVVRFVSPSGASVSSVVPGTGAATYSVTVPPGVWDVVVEGETACTATGVVPCHPSVRKKALTLNVSGSLDLDLPVVTVSGSVLANGQPLAAATNGLRGQLTLAGADGQGPTVTLPGTGAATWSTLVYAGTYDVVVKRTSCSGVGPLPCGEHTAKRQVPLTASGVLDLDLAVFDVTGQVLANGQPLKASPRGENRGTVAFGKGAGVALGTTGAASYQTRVYGGMHEVVLSNAQDCADGALPCGVRTLKTVNVTASGALDLDVAVVKVTGTLTVNGAAMGNSPSNTARGELVFDGPTAAPLRLTASGAATFSQTLYPGTYRVLLTNAADCPTGPVPCQTRVLEPAKALTADASVAWDLPVIEVAGAVTHNGQTVAASSAMRGELLFRDATGEAVAGRLGMSGPAAFRVRLYPANYQVQFRNTADCPAGDTSPLPCTGEVALAPFVELTASGSRDFDLKSVTISGLITVNGAQMGSNGPVEPRGAVRFAGFGTDATPVSRPLGAQGAAAYQVRLLPGGYDVALEGSTCSATSPLPCQQLVLAGCAAH